MNREISKPLHINVGPLASASFQRTASYAQDVSLDVGPWDPAVRWGSEVSCNWFCRGNIYTRFLKTQWLVAWVNCMSTTYLYIYITHMYNLYICIYMYIYIWLVVYLPLWKLSSSVGNIIPNSYNIYYFYILYIYHLLPLIATQPPIRDPPFRAPRRRHSAMPYEPTGPALAQRETHAFPQGGPWPNQQGWIPSGKRT